VEWLQNRASLNRIGFCEVANFTKQFDVPRGAAAALCNRNNMVVMQPLATSALDALATIPAPDLAAIRGSPSRSRATPGLCSETPFGFSDGAMDGKSRSILRVSAVAVMRLISKDFGRPCGLDRFCSNQTTVEEVGDYCEVPPGLPVHGLEMICPRLRRYKSVQNLVSDFRQSRRLGRGGAALCRRALRAKVRTVKSNQPAPVSLAPRGTSGDHIARSAHRTLGN
jgi:hypothetical protein